MSQLIIDHLSDLHVGELHCAAEIRVSVAERPKEPRNLALYRSQQSNNIDRDSIEIVRILLRKGPVQSDIERQTLENLDLDHRFFAIPLFVLIADDLGSIPPTDFVLGIDKDGNVLRCLECEAPYETVKEVATRRQITRLRRDFEKMLEHRSLQTVARYLGSGTMITSPAERRKFAENYDTTRGASSVIVERLRAHFGSEVKDVGLDIGCGTGNYTFPFLTNFKQVIGLDDDEEMLLVANSKPEAGRVQWKKGNAMATDLLSNTYDAIWCISTLHYFRADQQKKLFAEMFRLLRLGGAIAVDAGFSEQFSSLWPVEYFRSLTARYEGKIFSKQTYKQWLEEIGFRDVSLECFELEENCRDRGLRAGLDKPELYLDDGYLNGLPAFHEMDPEERFSGQKRLRQDIESHEVYKMMKRYSDRAPEKGPGGLILARKQWLL